MELRKLKRLVERQSGVILETKSRATGFVVPRSIYSKFAIQYTNATYQQIANTLERNHASVHNAVKQYDSLIDAYPRYRKIAEKIERKLNPDKYKKLDESVEVKSEEIIEMTTVKEAFLKDFKTLEDEDVLEFHETRLKPYISMLKSRKYHEHIPHKNGAMRKFTLKTC